MSENQKDVYIKFLRIFVFFIAGFLWYLSVGWSAEGFSIDNNELLWIGVGLALSVTGAELLFNRGSANPTIFLVGLSAYLYGFATNFIGISMAVGIDFSQITVNPLKIIVASVGVGALAIIVEAAPESFLLWALYPEEKKPGDFISTILNRKLVFSPKTAQNVPVNYTKQSYTPHSEQERSLNVQKEQNVFKNMNRKDRSVLLYIQQYRSEHDGNNPSYAKVVQNTHLTSTSQVGKYFGMINQLNRNKS